MSFVKTVSLVWSWIATAIIMLSCGGAAWGQSRPFPQHTPYTAGTILPDTVSQSALDDSTRAFYDRWKARYLKTGCNPGEYYILIDENDTTICVSEGLGYGMLIGALMAGYDPDARQYFDGLYRWSRSHPSKVNHDLMAWRQLTGCVSSYDSSSATDGDLDIAYALLLAHEQWGSGGQINYLYEGLKIIQAVKQDEINPLLNSVKLGDWSYAGEPLYYYGTRTSDFMMDHFRIYGQATGDPVWSAVVDTCYALIGKMQSNFSPAAGLVPDFIWRLNTSPAPAPANYIESPYDGYYNYNACRDPWRIATDYLVSGDPRAKNAVQKINTWMKTQTGGDPSLILSGYKLNGANIPGNNYSDASFTAPLMVGAMVDPSNQPWLNSLWSFVLSYPFSAGGYYQHTLTMLSMIVASGNWWSPDIQHSINFSGYAWNVKSSTGKVGPGPNYFSDSAANVRVDSAGRLHLRITSSGGNWHCAEVSLAQPLGYGRYVFHIESPVGTLDPNAVLGLFTWDDAPAENHREIDVEYSRWSDSTDVTNAQFVVQPWQHGGNLTRWTLPGSLDSSTTGFTWRQDSISFLTVKGGQTFPPYDSVVTSWNYAGADIPQPGNEAAHINLWLTGGLAPARNSEIEIVVSKFEFNPVPPQSDAPVLLSPDDNAIVASLPAVFRWSSTQNTVHYHLQIAADAGFTNLMVNDSTLTDSTTTTSSLTNRLYYWRVRVKNIAGGISRWSPVRKFTVTGASRWQLVSVPLRVGNGAVTNVYPGALSAAYAYNPSVGYVQSDTLYPGAGYWLKLPAHEIFSAAGDSITADTIPVAKGWNLIGSISSAVSVARIASDPPGMTVSSFFGYRNGYITADSILPAYGYWVKAGSKGGLILSVAAAANPQNRIRIIPTDELPPAPPLEQNTSSKNRIPAEFALAQNYPNPFNPVTTIRYAIPVTGFVSLKFFDILGREVQTLVNETLQPGDYSAQFDGTNLPSGVYFYRIQIGNFTDVKKILLMK
ncbi:MAG: glycosyl hydrolase family 8 [Bacteroidota bacterium]